MYEFVPTIPFGRLSFDWNNINNNNSNMAPSCLYAILVFLLLLCVTAANSFHLGSSLQALWKRWSSSFSDTTTTSEMLKALSKTDRSSSLSTMIPWWDDLAPPFALVDASDVSVDDGDDENDYYYYNNNNNNNNNNNHNIHYTAYNDEEDRVQVEDDVTDDTIQQRRRGAPQPAGAALTVTHFCFLVHGHRGLARDLAYLQAVMQLLAKRQKQKLRRRYNKSLSDYLSSSSSTSLSSETLQPRATATTTRLSSSLLSPSSFSAPSSDDESEVSVSSSSTAFDSAPPPPRPSEPVVLHHDLIIHSAVCNEGKTTDGVAKGGDRLAEEMLSVIRNEMAQRFRRPKTTTCSTSDRNNNQSNETLQDITISVVGNSLGGIYSRYAIAQLVKQCSTEAGTTMVPDSTQGDNNNHVCQQRYILDGRYRLHLNIFCTTASPHLGVSGHTYLPLPRTAEIGVAHAMGHTGKDLFRLNDLMKRMATSSDFLTPLSQFRKRIAYANAYGTDFPVPAATAAFLSPASTYPHYFEEQSSSSKQRTNTSEDDVWAVDEDELENNGLIIATLYTPPNAQFVSSLLDRGGLNDTDITDKDGIRIPPPTSTTDDLLAMSTCLDALGWKKVFVDIRREIPIAVSLPTTLLKRSKSDANVTSMMTTATTAAAVAATVAATSTITTITTSSTCDDDQQQSSTILSSLRPSTPELGRLATLQELRQRKGQVESRDVATAVGSAGDNIWNLPIGHNMIVAFSRSRISTLINKGGRPVVDGLAKELVEDIFSWKRSRVTTEAAVSHGNQPQPEEQQQQQQQKQTEP